MESCLFGEGVHFVDRIVVLGESLLLLFGKRVAQIVPVFAHEGEQVLDSCRSEMFRAG